MAAGARVYSSNQVKISIAGLLIAGGYADGDFVTVERDTEAFGDVVGTDGEVTRFATNDNRATVTVRLMQSSSMNKILSDLHNADKSAEGGAGVGRLLIEDLNGGTLHEAAACWIQNDPASSYGREVSEREWVIRVANLRSSFGEYA